MKLAGAYKGLGTRHSSRAQRGPKTLVGEAPAAEHVARLAGVLGITLSAVGLAALVTAVNLLLYGIGTWRARRNTDAA